MRNRTITVLLTAGLLVATASASVADDNKPDPWMVCVGAEAVNPTHALCVEIFPDP